AKRDECQIKSVFIRRLNQAYFAFHFFFPAEAGIRDGHVTGVQTCALPISEGRGQQRHPVVIDHVAVRVPRVLLVSGLEGEGGVRSEERRVGKECRSGGWRQHEKKKGKTSLRA